MLYSLFLPPYLKPLNTQNIKVKDIFTSVLLSLVRSDSSTSVGFLSQSFIASSTVNRHRHILTAELNSGLTGYTHYSSQIRNEAIGLFLKLYIPWSTVASLIAKLGRFGSTKNPGI